MHFNFDRAVRLLINENDYVGADPFLMRSHDSAELNCTIPSILEFPNFMRQKSILNTVVCLLASIYLFILLAIVCDDYLIPAMERLCYSLRMPYDVAGATFLAAATSAPELFVSIVGTFVTKGDIGIGTIVGSSVFNVLGIGSVCGILTGVSLKLDWWPITRDTLWYFISIGGLFVVLRDSVVEVHEASFLLSGYFVYLIGLLFDRRIQSLFRTVDTDLDMMTTNPLEREDAPLKTFKQTVCETPEEGSNYIMKIWWAIKYPAVLVLAVTTPSARSIFFLSLLMSVVWICITSYFVAWFLTVVGYNMGVPDSIMGLTVLAAGTSVPEIVASYIVCRKGYGLMALCNAIGSNTFDIFICLGMPWLISILISSKNVVINSAGLTITTGMLLVTAFVLYASFLCTKFVLGKFVGWVSFIAYIIFLAIAIFLEIKMLRKVCDIESDEYAFLS
ncbi:sodium/potassium/calcium exchanger 3 isoform X2 [Drosophila grimshawi]|uniref:sodium/potassium/calcium exchanger 3 isoform X2 n=1 Tax=Drosophila grimshawi TaxID=7222 RepID=UPI001C9324AE|nr:sodium/potassium/calcium exchanger 3 isoform X2 [Drosophila grimshawi]